MSTTKPRKRPPEPRRISRRALQRAKPIALRYRIVLWREDGEWYGQGVEEPGAMGDGKTVAQCVRRVREALTAVVASNLEAGEAVVTPILDQDRRGKKAG